MILYYYPIPTLVTTHRKGMNTKYVDEYIYKHKKNEEYFISIISHQLSFQTSRLCFLYIGFASLGWYEFLYKQINRCKAYFILFKLFRNYLKKMN